MEAPFIPGSEQVLQAGPQHVGDHDVVRPLRPTPVHAGHPERLALVEGLVEPVKDIKENVVLFSILCYQ